jgi:ssRNA-specific RNase YbeY (16S rRNA maturation enzyme)
MARKQKARVKDGRVNSRTKSEVRDTRRALGDVSSDRRGDRVAKVITKSERNQIFDKEERGAKSNTDTISFKSSVVCASRDMSGESSKQFGRTVKGSVRG